VNSDLHTLLLLHLTVVFPDETGIAFSRASSYSVYSRRDISGD